MNRLVCYFLLLPIVIGFFSCTQPEHALLIPDKADMVLKFNLPAFAEKKLDTDKLLRIGFEEEYNLLNESINKQQPVYRFFYNDFETVAMTFGILDDGKLKRKQEQLGHVVQVQDGIYTSIMGNYILAWKNGKAICSQNNGNRMEILGFFNEDQSLYEQHADFTSCIKADDDISGWVGMKSIQKEYPSLNSPEYDISGNSLSLSNNFENGKMSLEISYTGVEKYFLSTFLRDGVSSKVLKELPSVDSKAYFSIAISEKAMEEIFKTTLKQQGAGIPVDVSPLANVFTGEGVYMVDKVENLKFGGYLTLGVKNRGEVKKSLKQMGFSFGNDDTFKMFLLPVQGKLNQHSVTIALRPFEEKQTEHSKEVENILSSSPLSAYVNVKELDDDHLVPIRSEATSVVKELQLTSSQSGTINLDVFMLDDTKNAFELLTSSR
ncbi:MAG: DUF4836 family protein [Cytophagales bacterium]|nr:DUF4836 family protein [Cytophagales bacterium]